MREYWSKPEATAETIDADGWLHTGDVGHVDDDGFVHITDRIKELIVTAGGKNVAPQPLENALKSDPFIAQAMVIGDRRNFITRADRARARRLLSVGGGTVSRATSRPVRRAADRPLQAIVDAKMAAFSRYERVRKITLVPDEFTQEAGELTPTLKLKRRVLLAKYAAIIDGCTHNPHRDAVEDGGAAAGSTPVVGEVVEADSRVPRPPPGACPAGGGPSRGAG